MPKTSMILDTEGKLIDKNNPFPAKLMGSNGLPIATDSNNNLGVNIAPLNKEIDSCTVAIDQTTPGVTNAIQLSGSILEEQKTQADATFTAEVASLTITAAATVASNVTVTLNGVGATVAVLSTDTAIQVADKIRATAFTGWATGGTVGTATVTFTSTTPGNKTDATYSAGTTGATGTMTTTAQGTNAVLTFAQPISVIELYNTDAVNTGIFTVNGIDITVPATKSFKASVGGTSSPSVTVTGATTYIVSRYV